MHTGAKCRQQSSTERQTGDTGTRQTWNQGNGQTGVEPNRQTDTVHIHSDETEKTAMLLSLSQSHTAEVTFQTVLESLTREHVRKHPGCRQTCCSNRWTSRQAWADKHCTDIQTNRQTASTHTGTRQQERRRFSASRKASLVNCLRKSL